MVLSNISNFTIIIKIKYNVTIQVIFLNIGMKSRNLPSTNNVRWQCSFSQIPDIKRENKIDT